MYSDAILEKVKLLHQLDLEGRIKTLQKHEVHPELPIGSRDNYLYFTLPCCLNFQRSSPALWRSAYETFQDSETRYLFYPEQVVERDEEQIRRDLRKHSLAIQTNKHPRIWLDISHTLYQHYQSHPAEIVKEGDFEVKRIVQILQQEKKHLFPYLGGIKLSNYWLFIIHRFTDVQLKDTHEISIIPDTHVIRSTVKLGLAVPGVSAIEVERIWRAVLAKVHISPVDMHSALWKWSRDDFRPDIESFQLYLTL